MWAETPAKGAGKDGTGEGFKPEASPGKRALYKNATSYFPAASYKHLVQSGPTAPGPRHLRQRFGRGGAERSGPRHRPPRHPISAGDASTTAGRCGWAQARSHPPAAPAPLRAPGPAPPAAPAPLRAPGRPPGLSAAHRPSGPSAAAARPPGPAALPLLLPLPAPPASPRTARAAPPQAALAASLWLGGRG